MCETNSRINKDRWFRKLKFYVDYYFMIIELFEKQEKDAGVIKEEYQMLLQKIYELESRSLS